MSFNGLHQEIFDCQHDGDKGKRVAEDRRHVEELEIEVKLEAHPVRAPEQFHHENDFPDEREARARGRGKVGLKLRECDIAQLAHRRQPVGARHLVKSGIERTGALAQSHDDIRDLVEDGDA